MNERWLPVPGYEGLYSVSDQGRVRSEARLTGYRKDGRALRVNERLLSLNNIVKPGGHVRLCLRRGGRAEMFLAHRLVLAAFVGPCPEGMVARHLNGEPTDNRLENLAYGTMSENTHDSVGHGTHHFAAKTRCPQGHEYNDENTYVHNGSRSCKRCAVDRTRQYRLRARSS